ncbi:unnamed protein product [Didymodactylos carnosus]|uniref:Uncharacterized protein n=1 Tax=Didymodactylos carnosus TaxID=1234261 RepID=A0A8S2GB27_9BILA|nr:unnamed protein product [Didymodactylos carnosus]CAF4558318.1 unnamed protein product [Didymodactylos carnosus]
MIYLILCFFKIGADTIENQYRTVENKIIELKHPMKKLNGEKILDTPYFVATLTKLQDLSFNAASVYDKFVNVLKQLQCPGAVAQFVYQANIKRICQIR